MADTISGITTLNGTATQARVTVIDTGDNSVAATALSDSGDGTFSFAGLGTGVYELLVQIDGQKPTVDGPWSLVAGLAFTNSMPDVEIGEIVDFTYAASGGSGTKTFSVSSGALPSGLSINSSTGQVTGTVGGSETTAEFTVTVTDDTGSVDLVESVIVTSPVPTDEYIDNVVLLLNAAGSDGSTTIVDEIGNGWTAHGDAQVDDSLGYNALAFDGSGDYIQLNTNPLPTDLQLGSSDFTIDFWARLSGTGAYEIVGNLNDGTGAGHYWVILNSTYLGQHSVQFGTSGSGTKRFGSSTLATNTLMHIALVRDGADLHCFVGGTRVNVTGSGLPAESLTNFVGNYTVPYLVGASYSNIVGHTYYLNGWIKALRITKGVARWTTDFTPPDAPFPSV